MIGWYTDNPLSRTVMESIPGIELRHVRGFNEQNPERNQHVFYGILRGCSRCMQTLDYMGLPYYYIDNGYFDALYVDKAMHKNMEGKFRMVKNGMHEVYIGGAEVEMRPTKNILVIPPSPYSANFYDTTPEDWFQSLEFEDGAIPLIRSKNCQRPLGDDLQWCDGVIAFNSMLVMRAIEMGKPVTDTHGIFRNPWMMKYSLDDLRAFYEPKQFTLEEFRQGKCQWN